MSIGDPKRWDWWIRESRGAGLRVISRIIDPDAVGKSIPYTIGTDQRPTAISREMWDHFQELVSEEYDRQATEIKRLRALVRAICTSRSGARWALPAEDADNEFHDVLTRALEDEP